MERKPCEGYRTGIFSTFNQCFDSCISTVFLFTLNYFFDLFTENLYVVFIPDPLLKVIFTVISIFAGFKGGEVTPLMAIEASLGSFLSPILELL